jgi:hypothetical protein
MRAFIWVISVMIVIVCPMTEKVQPPISPVTVAIPPDALPVDVTYIPVEA